MSEIGEHVVQGFPYSSTGWPFIEAHHLKLGLEARERRTELME